MNKINDRDLTELSSFWAYNDINTTYRFNVNDKYFIEVNSFSDNINHNTKGSGDFKTFELLNENGKRSGKQVIIFQGTDNKERISPDNPLKGKLADDWLQNMKLMNNDNKTIDLLKQSDKYVNTHQQKIIDASKLNEKEFANKYSEDPKKYKNKKIVAFGGNSQGGAVAKYQGAKYSDVRVVATDPAMLPLSSWGPNRKPNYKNIINFHSHYDMLSWLQDPFNKDLPSKRVNFANGIPSPDGLVDSHIGYKRKYIRKYNTYKDIPARRIKSVKDTKTKNGKTVPKNINIMLDMDGRIPINVWTGESIARSGEGTLISLDVHKLDALYQLVIGETSTMLKECVTYLNESYYISQAENSQFGERKQKLKQDFKDKIFLSDLEDFSNELKTKSKRLEDIIDRVNGILFPISHLIPYIGLDPLNRSIHELSKRLENAIDAVYGTVDDTLTKMFKNIDHDFQDGVSEELMKHLKIVSQNIEKVKKQNDIYGKQIADLKEIMSYQDATVMDGNLNINYSGEHMVTEQIEPSEYLTRKMSILKDHIDDALEDLSTYLQELYNERFKPIVDTFFQIIEDIQVNRITIKAIISALDSNEITKFLKTSLLSVDFIKNSLEELDHELSIWLEFLHDLSAASPILEQHLDDILMNVKPMLVDMIFEPSRYDDMFALNTESLARLDQMAQQFKVVCNGLNENDGKAIQTMDASANLILSNINILKEQLEKIAVY